MANIRQTIEDVEKLAPELAQQIKKYVKEHAYGLVYESSLPEAVRLYTKTPSINDTVNLRPPRGQEEREENRQPWTVKDIQDGTATIDNGQEQRQVPTDDLVPIVSYNDVIYPGLREVDRIERGDKDDPYQVVINAENYHALEMLTYCYAGKVDCIYIDPPYNTGAKDWKYNNDYVDSNDKYRHSKWLAFMERRLKLAKKLLNPKDSVLICTIDEKEYTRLGLLLEQVFPEARIQMVSSVINPKGQSRGGACARVDEYIFLIQLGNSAIAPLPLASNWRVAQSTSTDKIQWTTLRRRGRMNNSLRTNSPGCFYPIFIKTDDLSVHSIGEALPLDKHPDSVVAPEGTVAVWPMRPDGEEGCYQTTPEHCRELLAKGYLHITSATVGGINYIKSGEQHKVEDGVYKVIGHNSNDGSVIVENAGDVKFMPTTQWNIPSHNAGDYGKRFLNAMFGDSRFTYPKSLYAVHDVLRFFVADKPNALIIDFFGGSGTTLHAVNLLNAEDGGKRRCICVTNNEVSSEEQKALAKNGLRPGDPEWEARGIARYVTWPRTKCSIEGVDVNGNPLKGEYGCLTDSYEPYDADIIDPETGKKARGKAYRKVKTQMYPDMEGMKMSDGFKANAIFFDLTYESEWPIRLDNAFDAIAPILWMQAGCRGPIIHRVGKSYLITDYYGVLFKYGQASSFVSAVRMHPGIKTVFVVTDDQRRFSSMCRRLPGMDVHRLYETFLKTFEICGEGGLD